MVSKFCFHFHFFSFLPLCSPWICFPSGCLFYNSHNGSSSILCLLSYFLLSYIIISSLLSFCCLLFDFIFSYFQRLISIFSFFYANLHRYFLYFYTVILILEHDDSMSVESRTYYKDVITYDIVDHPPLISYNTSSIHLWCN